MATTCKLIAKNVLGSDTATVTFGSIPATFDDLLFVASTRSERSLSYDTVSLRFNNAADDTNLSCRGLQGDGSSATSFSLSSGRIGITSGDTATADTFGSLEVYIPNYAGASNKSYSSTGVSESNSASNVYIEAVAGLWSDTSAITAVSFILGGSRDFLAGSTFYLYGITKA